MSTITRPIYPPCENPFLVQAFGSRHSISVAPAGMSKLIF